MHVVLVHPEIAPNTGNIIRLCANTGTTLHLVEPLGFELDDRLLRRAGLDYHELTTVRTHPDIDSASLELPGRWFGFASAASHRFDEVEYADDDVLVFGAEHGGLPNEVEEHLGPEQMLTIPMRPGNRSLNLANAVAVVVYEAWRQTGYLGAALPGRPLASEGLTAETPATPPFDR